MTKQLSLIILTYNSEKDIYDCLRSVYQYNDIGDKLEIIVVDNNSAGFEAMRQNLQTQYPEVIVIKNEKNGGYGQGNNIGIKASSAPIIAIMNPDVRLIMPVFSTFLQVLASDNVIMCGGKQYMDNYQAIKSFDCDFMTPIIYQMILYPIWRRLDIFKSNKMWLSGAFFLIRKDLFTQIGLFDENIFMYCEENDIMRRMHQQHLNKKILFVPHLHYIHCIEERQFSEKATEREFASQIYMCKKNNIPLHSFVKHEKRKFAISRIITFLRTLKWGFSPYQKYKLQLLAKYQ